jgi:hypothetical protein
MVFRSKSLSASAASAIALAVFLGFAAPSVHAQDVAPCTPATGAPPWPQSPDGTCSANDTAGSAVAWPHTGKYGFGTRQLRIKNHLSKELYVEVLSGGSSALKSDKFMLEAGCDTLYEVPNVWRASRLWGRTEKVQSGPSTLIEWTMGTRDWYDISLVDGYNLPVTISPVPGTYVKSDPTDPFQCGSISCTEDLLPDCPEALQKKDEFGRVQQCLSACSRYNKDEFCCRGVYDSAEVCRPSDWEVDYPKVFKNACPTSVTYAFDDSSNTFICPAGSQGVGPDYEIGFGALRTSPGPNTSVRAASPSPHARLRAAFSATMLRYAVDAGDGKAELRLALYGAGGRKFLDLPVSASEGGVPLPPMPAGVYHLVLASSGRILESLEWISGGAAATRPAAR